MIFVKGNKLLKGKLSRISFWMSTDVCWIKINFVCAKFCLYNVTNLQMKICIVGTPNKSVNYGSKWNKYDVVLFITVYKFIWFTWTQRSNSLQVKALKYIMKIRVYNGENRVNFSDNICICVCVLTVCVTGQNMVIKSCRL